MRKFLRLLSVLVSTVLFISGFSVFNTSFATEGDEIPDFEVGTVLVVLKDSADTDDDLFGSLAVDSVDTLMNIENTNGDTDSSENTRIVKVNLISQQAEDVLKAVEVLQNNPNVLVAQPDYFAYVEDTTPDDEFYSELYGMDKISAPKAWDKFTGSKDVVVGIMDTGIDNSNSDLADNMWINPNPSTFTYSEDGVNRQCINDIHGWNFYDKSSVIMDVHSHGTHVAGIVGASGNNSIGVTGVNWNVSLAALKVCSNGGAARVSAMISALAYANHYGIKLISCSLGWYDGRFKTEENDALCIAIKDYNGLFIASAGNDGYNSDNKMHYPSDFKLPNVICVGETNEKDNNVWNYGKETVHLGAPGASILSTGIHTKAADRLGSDKSRYVFKGGTSMATPHVSGALALVMGYKPNLTPLKAKDIILRSVDKLPQLESRYITGGRLNINNALDLADESEISVTIQNSSYDDVFRFDSVNLLAKGAYVDCDIYMVIDKYSASDVKLSTVSNTIHINDMGEGIYTNIPETIQFDSNNEHLKIELYEVYDDVVVYQTPIMRQLVYPISF